jgi:hypothetical protein
VSVSSRLHLVLLRPCVPETKLRSQAKDFAVLKPCPEGLCCGFLSGEMAEATILNSIHSPYLGPALLIIASMQPFEVRCMILWTAKPWPCSTERTLRANRKENGRLCLSLRRLAEQQRWPSGSKKAPRIVDGRTRVGSVWRLRMGPSRCRSDSNRFHLCSNFVIYDHLARFVLTSHLTHLIPHLTSHISLYTSRLTSPLTLPFTSPLLRFSPRIHISHLV